MPTLFSYCIPIDDGAAPNPFWGVCTLAICKPQIRKHAQIGDWIVGTGSAKSPIGNISGQVVYAMKVTTKKTMQDYDSFTKVYLEKKIPNAKSRDRRRKLGDSIYDFSYSPPLLRKSVHREKNREKDLGGIYALLSDHFYYFGDQPIPLPAELLGIVKQRQGHKSRSNDKYFKEFVDWIENMQIPPNSLVGEPQMWSANGNRDRCSDDCQSDCGEQAPKLPRKLGTCS